MAAGYKSLVGQLREMLASHRATWHAVTSLAVSIFEDTDLRGDAGLVDEYKAAEWMDAQFGFPEECGLGFLQLRAMIGRYPQPEQWTRPLAVLHAEAVAQTTAEDAADREPVTRVRVSRRDVEERDKKIADLEYRVRYAEKEAGAIAELKGELADLRAENKQLRAENADLRKELAARLHPAVA